MLRFIKYAVYGSFSLGSVINFNSSAIIHEKLILTTKMTRNTKVFSTKDSFFCITANIEMTSHVRKKNIEKVKDKNLQIGKLIVV